MLILHTSQIFIFRKKRNQICAHQDMCSYSQIAMIAPHFVAFLSLSLALSSIVYILLFAKTRQVAGAKFPIQVSNMHDDDIERNADLLEMKIAHDPLCCLVINSVEMQRLQCCSPQFQPLQLSKRRDEIQEPFQLKIVSLLYGR